MLVHRLHVTPNAQGRRKVFMHALTATSLPIYWLASSMARLDYSGVYMVNLQLFLVATYMHWWPGQPGVGHTDLLN